MGRIASAYGLFLHVCAVKQQDIKYGLYILV